MIKQIIFDCDGVLVDTEISAAKVMVKKLNKLGIPISESEYINTFTGSTFSKIFKHFLPNTAVLELQELVSTSETETHENLTEIKGIPSLIKSLAFPVAVVSNSSLRQINNALITIDLDDHITQRFSSEMVDLPKPSPAVYLHAAKLTGFSPAECLVVEDSIMGVQAAVSAGMTVIGFIGGSHIQPGHEKQLIKNGATYIAPSSYHLNKLLNQLIN